MKDRWKIFWISVFLSIILAALFLFMGFSLRKIDLGNYGILGYDYYDTIDTTQSPRINGNYLVGLDHSFIEFPRKLITHQFTITTLTKDKSMIQIDGIYIGKLVYSELINIYFAYGSQYEKFLFSSVQQLFHEAIEQFSLNQLISNRVGVDLYVKNYVKSMIESQYKWIVTKFINLGGIKSQLLTRSIIPDVEIQQYYLRMIKESLLNQQKMNIYTSGGFELLKELQDRHGQLLYNVSKELKVISDKLLNVSQPLTGEIISGIQYVINGDNMPLLDNRIQIMLSK